MAGEVRRPIPGQEVREQRTLNLLEEMNIVGEFVDLPPPGFEPGNKKTGTSGGRFNSVIVWNIPPAVTCPGASEWCLSVCYNGDDRPDILQKDKWRANLAAFNEDPDNLSAVLRDEIRQQEHPLAVRIHSSGDFFSDAYSKFWASTIEEHPDVTFWAYTRSWRIPGLKGSLAELKSKRNLQLFASWDETMPNPPEGWRVSYVKDSGTTFEIPSNLTRCPEEYREGMNCARCGFCLRNIGRGVLFNAH